MECSINSQAISLLMKHLVIGQRLLGFSLVTTFIEKDRNKLNYQIGPKRTKSPVNAAMYGLHSLLCGLCIAAVAGCKYACTMFSAARRDIRYTGLD